MRKLLILFSIGLLTLSVSAQEKEGNGIPAKSRFVDVSAGFGQDIFTVPVGYFYNWQLGKKHRFIIGTGLRLSGIWGNNLTYTSAPASLAGESASEDTLTVPKAGVYAANLILNLGYNFSPRLQAGFNIDAIGFSFGPEQSAIFQSNGINQTVTAKPTSFNWLLVGNNDKGSLNSEFYLRYRVGKNLGLKAAYQYLFTEYTTDRDVQTIPDSNDRFRNKSSLFNIGVTWFL